MSKLLKLLLVVILLFSVYHLARDILQATNNESVLTDIGHRPHTWCAEVCDYVTLPLDAAGIIVSLYILRRDHFGRLGLSLVAALFIALGAALWLP